MPSKPQDFKKSNKNLTTTNAKAWKKGTGAKAVDVELPSGNVAKLKQIPMTTLLSDGLFPDSLAGMIQEAISDKSGKKAVIDDSQMQDMVGNPKQLAEMFEVFDKVTLLSVVEPPLLAAPADDADRDDDLLYVDEVDIEDKAFIFQYCVGGSSDLERFRTESTSAVGGMAALASVPPTP